MAILEVENERNWSCLEGISSFNERAWMGGRGRTVTNSLERRELIRVVLEPSHAAPPRRSINNRRSRNVRSRTSDRLRMEDVQAEVESPDEGEREVRRSSDGRGECEWVRLEGEFAGADRVESAAKSVAGACFHRLYECRGEESVELRMRDSRIVAEGLHRRVRKGADQGAQLVYRGDLRCVRRGREGEGEGENAEESARGRLDARPGSSALVPPAKDQPCSTH